LNCGSGECNAICDTVDDPTVTCGPSCGCTDC
jgi:hypothetical protein